MKTPSSPDLSEKQYGRPGGWYPLFKRTSDCILAVFFLLVSLPPALLIWIVRDKAEPLVVRQTKIGRDNKPFSEWTFRLPENRIGRMGRMLRWHRIPTLLNILRGDMSFIGPRALRPEEAAQPDEALPTRFAVRPGLVCLWWIRSRANIHYGREFEMDREYIETIGFRTDLALTVKAIPALLFGIRPAPCPDRANILGVSIHNVAMDDAIGRIRSWLEAEDPTPRLVCFANSDCVNIACRDAEYRRVLEQADLVPADGIGMKMAGILLEQPIRQNVNGTDLFPLLCKSLDGTPTRVFLLGGRPGVAEQVADWIGARHPGLTLCGWHHGYFSEAEESDVLNRIRQSRCDLLLVAMGAPKQERWMDRCRFDTGAKVLIGVGGLFDFYSGQIPRAPLWMREVGLEWLYRFSREPGRLWKRYWIGNVVFLFRVLKARAARSADPL